MNPPHIFQIVGFKNAGKTTLLCKLIGRLKASGKLVGTIKHDGHDFVMDHPGTDTWQHQQAGADAVAITSAHQTAWIRKQATPLEDLIEGMSDMDVILVEGFKTADYPKLVLLRSPEDQVLLSQLSHPVGIIYGYDEVESNLPLRETPGFHRDDDADIARLLLSIMGD
ncbi:molybdopterin-guanine dinucleotide biosynthesis protein B [Paenibacillus daejeonensis]|uniref:molybdopterin-guanine dinucleotide biosynthesis protein B n=1 Tax=Paenibacillus daejeonensis TaxID=135193 RepID=UPI00037BBB12|nr:molybdopterin-guanine dinucleotide biosynthesis protein B [Paenibacillus daejeonensis]